MNEQERWLSHALAKLDGAVEDLNRAYFATGVLLPPVRVDAWRGRLLDLIGEMRAARGDAERAGGGTA